MGENVPLLRVIPPERRVRFGPFELDSRAGELRKHGIKIKIGQQALEILMMLLRHPGEVVLREEIRQKLWPLDTVVEFDHSINAAIQKLRDALGESAGDPKYIETLPRRGYRFIGTVEEPRAEAASEATPRTAGGIKPGSRHWLVLAAAALGVLTMLGLAAFLRFWEPRDRARNWTFSIPGLPPQTVLSPDGSSVIYTTARGLSLRRLDSGTDTPLYTEAVVSDKPAWSPDGSQVLFRSNNRLIRMPLPNGPPMVLWQKAGITRGFAWGPDGTILAATLSNRLGSLFMIRSKGGDPVRLEVPGLNNGIFLYPEFLPDGKSLLFAWDTADEPDEGLYLASFERGKITGAPVLLRRNLSAGHYAVSVTRGGGSLLYVENDKIYAQRLNVGRRSLEGEPELVAANGVYSEYALAWAAFSVSRTGVLAWKEGRAGLAKLTWFDRKGNVTATAGPPCTTSFVRLSPDEKHVLLHTIAERDGVGIVEENRNGQVELPGLDAPLWTQDGSHIVYARKEGTSYRVMERAVEGGAETGLARLPAFAKLRDISPDGKFLLYKANQEVYAVRLGGSAEGAKPDLVAETMQGQFSPDGRWVLYSALTNGGARDVFVQPFPSGGLRTQLTSAGGYDAVWRGDGKEILYRNGKTIYSLRVEARGVTIHASVPQALFDVRVAPGVFESMPLAVTRDGSRILFAQGVEQPNPQLTYVMTNWESVLKK